MKKIKWHNPLYGLNISQTHTKNYDSTNRQSGSSNARIGLAWWCNCSGEQIDYWWDTLW